MSCSNACQRLADDGGVVRGRKVTCGGPEVGNHHSRTEAKTLFHLPSICYLQIPIDYSLATTTATKESAMQ